MSELSQGWHEWSAFKFRDVLISTVQSSQVMNPNESMNPSRDFWGTWNVREKRTTSPSLMVVSQGILQALAAFEVAVFWALWPLRSTKPSCSQYTAPSQYERLQSKNGVRKKWFRSWKSSGVPAIGFQGCTQKTGSPLWLRWKGILGVWNFPISNITLRLKWRGCKLTWYDIWNSTGVCFRIYISMAKKSSNLSISCLNHRFPHQTLSLKTQQLLQQSGYRFQTTNQNMSTVATVETPRQRPHWLATASLLCHFGRSTQRL